MCLWKCYNVTAGKSVFGPSTVTKSKRLPKAAELSRMPVPLQPAGVEIFHRVDNSVVCEST